MFFYFIFLEGRSSPKRTTSNSKDEYSSSLSFSIEIKETRDAQTTKIYNNPEERTHSLISTYSDTTLDQSVTTFSGPIDHHLQSKKKGKNFWVLILLPISSIIIIVMALLVWKCGKMIKKRRSSAENRVNINLNEDFEMGTITNENFQETSFDRMRQD